MPDAIPQCHGGALRPFPPGNGPSANRTSLKKVNREVMDILATRAPDLAKRMVERAMETDDDRVLAVITTNVLDRVQGRPTDRPQTFENGPTDLDTTHLSPEEVEHALECARHLQRYLMLAAERAGVAKP